MQLVAISRAARYGQLMMSTCSSLASICTYAWILHPHQHPTRTCICTCTCNKIRSDSDHGYTTDRDTQKSLIEVARLAAA